MDGLMTRLARVGFDLPSQSRDADVDASIEWLATAMVREIKQPIARQNTIGILRESVQQIEFHACECDHLAIGCNNWCPSMSSMTGPNCIS